MKPLFLLILFCLASAGSCGAWAEEEICDPATYRSPSGNYVLQVEPSDKFGLSGSDCRLTSGGKEVWGKKMPFTPREAIVTDDGTVAGCGYSERVDADGRKVTDLHRVIFGPRGETRFEETRKRETESPGPVILSPSMVGLLFHPGANRVTFRMSIREAETWGQFDLATGKEVLRIRPANALLTEFPTHGTRILSVRALAETPLTLVHWQLFQEPKQYASLFTILDADGEQIWKKLRPGTANTPRPAVPEVESDPSEAEEATLKRESIFDTSQPGTFSLRLAAEKKRARFSVLRKGEGWAIKQTALEPDLPPRAEPEKEALIPEVKLQALGEFPIEPLPDQPVQSISAWDFDGEGNIGFIRDPSKATAFVLINAEGKVLQEIPLEDRWPSGGKVDLVWSAGARWFLNAGTKVWRLDAEKKTATLLANFASPPIKSIAGTSDGGFVVLTNDFKNLNNPNAVISFDALGQKRWQIDKKTNPKEFSFFSPSFAVTRGGDIAVLQERNGLVSLFNAKGKLLRKIQAPAMAERGWSSSTEVVADREGGFIVFESYDSKPFLWIKADGTLRETFAPTYGNGQVMTMSRIGVKVAPDGNLWCSDSDAFYRLNAERRSTQSIGLAAGPGILLHFLHNVRGDGGERVYALDSSTFCVHVFDDQGRKIRVNQPNPDDFQPDSQARLTAAPDGSVMVLSDEQHLLFDGEGRRLGKQPDLGLDGREREQWIFHAGSQNRIVLNEKVAVLTDGEGKVQRRLERQADRKWLVNLREAVVARDQTLAIEHGQKMSEQRCVTIFSKEGEALKTLPTPFGMLFGMNATHLLVAQTEAIFLVDRADGTVQRFTPPMKDEHFWPLLMREGRELWMVETENRKVTRYALPEGK